MVIDVTFTVTGLLVLLQFMNPFADLFPSYIQIGMFFIWLFLIARRPKFLIKCIKISILSGIIMFVTLLRCIIANKMDTSFFSPLQSVIQQYQFVVYPTMYMYISSLDNKKKKKLFDLFILSITVTLVVSLYYVLVVDPQAIRNTQGVSYFGVGDFQFVYALAILSGPFFTFIRRRKENKENYGTYLIVFSLSCLCIILCNLVTSVVIMVASIALSYYLASNKSFMKMLLVILAGIIVLLKNFWANLLRKIASKGILYWSTSNKLIAIANLISGSGENLDTLSSRVRLTNISLNSFKEHMLFGIDFSNHQSGVVGCHAQWADDLARFGIIGNIFIWGNYLFVVKYVLKNCKCEQIKISLITVFILFFVLGFLNPALSGTILMCIFVIIPSMEFNYSVSEFSKSSK